MESDDDIRLCEMCDEEAMRGQYCEDCYWEWTDHDTCGTCLGNGSSFGGCIGCGGRDSYD